MSYIIRYTGPEMPDTKKLKKVLADNQVKILDSSSLPKMVLVDQIKGNLISSLNQAQLGWQIFPQNNSYKVPDTRRKATK